MDNRALWILLLFVNILLADTDGTDSIFLRLFDRNGSHIDRNIKDACEFVHDINTALETVLFIHGFSEDVDAEDVKLITDAYLQVTNKNVLAMDYRKLSHRLYTTSVAYVSPIGDVLADFVNCMIDAGLNPKKLHIIGHSLGAQIAGNTGRNLKVKIPRITALDAAGPLFYIVGPRLRPTDAHFVDAIHTDSGFYGTLLSVGTVNFYPDFGHRPQPGCSALDVLGFCSHHRSYMLYAESVRRPNIFVARKCSDLISFKLGMCNNNNETTVMGYGTPSDVKGNYYLTTDVNTPYGLGMKGSTYSIL